jgi:hypothetical protein
LNDDPVNVGIFDSMGTKNLYDNEAWKDVKLICEHNDVIVSADFLKFTQYVSRHRGLALSRVLKALDCIALILPKVQGTISISCTKYIMLFMKQDRHAQANNAMRGVIDMLISRGAKFNACGIDAFVSIGYIVTLDQLVDRPTSQIIFEYVFGCNKQNNLIEKFSEYQPIIQSIMKKNKITFNQRCVNLLFEKLQNIVDGKNIVDFIQFARTNDSELSASHIVQIFCHAKPADYQMIVNCLGVQHVTSDAFTNICCTDLLTGDKLLQIINKSNQYVKLELDAMMMQKIIRTCRSQYSTVSSRLKFFELLAVTCCYTVGYDLMQIVEKSFDASIIKFFSSSINSMDPVKEFITAISTGNIECIRKLIDNKYQPKAEYLYHLAHSYGEDCKKNREIIELFMGLQSLGITIDRKLHIHLKLSHSDTIQELEFPDDDMMISGTINSSGKTGTVNPSGKMSLNDYVDNIMHSNAWSLSGENPVNKDITTMPMLRKLFRTADVDELKNYLTRITNKKVSVDITCLFNALLNQNIETMHYVIDTYQYKPSKFDISMVCTVPRRYMLTQMFYPDSYVLECGTSNLTDRETVQPVKVQLIKKAGKKKVIVVQPDSDEEQDDV